MTLVPSSCLIAFVTTKFVLMSCISLILSIAVSFNTSYLYHFALKEPDYLNWKEVDKNNNSHKIKKYKYRYI